MTTFANTQSYLPPLGLKGALQRLADEVSALAQAFAAPTKLVAEVEQMRALQQRADGMQHGDPSAAAQLRRQALRLCRR